MKQKIQLVVLAVLAGVYAFLAWQWRADQPPPGREIGLAVGPVANRAPARSLEAAGRDRPEGLPDVVLITIDTLRSDHLGVYGYSRETSPAIDRLARDGVVFDAAFSPAPRTSPSLASLMSGLPVKDHRVYALRIPLDPSIPTLGEVLQRAGYLTAGFCGQFNCSRKSGLGRGFDHYEDDFEGPETWEEHARLGGGFHPTSEKRGAAIVDSALGWLEERGSGSAPVFAWLHLMDPHAGYAPPAPYREHFSGPSPFSHRSVLGKRIPLDRIHPQAKISSVNRYDRYLNLYDAEIRYADEQLGRLFDDLRRKALYDDALILLTSDHGEYMGESARHITYFGHGESLFDSELRIPLIVKLPDGRLGGTRRSNLVSLTEVMPGVLSVLGLSAPEGRPTDGLWAGERESGEPDKAVFAQSPRAQADFSVRTRTHKLVFRSGLDTGELTGALRRGETVKGRYWLYDLRSDPLEREPLGAEGEALARRLATKLAGWLASERVVELERAPDMLDDEETLRHLRALGYVDE